MPILKAIPATVLTAVAAAVAAVNLETRVQADLAPVGLGAMIADLVPAAEIATTVDLAATTVGRVVPVVRRMIATVRRVLRRSQSAKSFAYK